MDEYISRQTLLDEINEEIEYGEEHFRPENAQINKGLKIARKLVRALPAIEAVIREQYCPDDDGSCSKAGVDLREMLDEIEGLDETEVQSVKHGR